MSNEQLTPVDRVCPDCATPVGAPHVDGCDIARCTECGHQRITCDHGDSDPGWGQVWTGRWPGEGECEELGLWSTDGEWYDLNQLRELTMEGHLVWDRNLQRWRRP